MGLKYLLTWGTKSLIAENGGEYDVQNNIPKVDDEKRIDYETTRNARIDMFHVFVLAYTPLQLVFCDPPSLDDVIFGKWPFGKMSGGLRKNSEPLTRSWDLEEFPASL